MAPRLSLQLLIFFLFAVPVYAARIPGKVTICGVGKNIEKAIPYTIINLEAMGDLFEDYRIFIYENNSQDKSADLLKQWSEKNPKVSVKSEFLSPEVLATISCNKPSYRPELIARARNIVLDQIMDPLYDDYAYVIWVDLDFEHLFPFEEIVNTFHSTTEWDAVFANGVKASGKHADLYALRDCILPLGAEFIGDEWWNMRAKKNRPYLKPKDPWMPVLSAFGGMGIYKRKALLGCRYSALATVDLAALAITLIEKGKEEKHPEILLYLKKNKKLNHIIRIPHISPHMTDYTDLPHVAFLLGTQVNGPLFRLAKNTGHYPSLCEHVPFHASMILHSHNKLYINPALVLHYNKTISPT